MTPKRIILVRHGRSAANDDPTVYSRMPDYKIELVEQGCEEARQAGDHIRELIGGESYGIYVSPYRRTIQTKDCIVKRIGHAPAFDYQEPYLREQEMGNMPAIIDNELNWEARKRYGTFFYRFPDGESCADIYDRMCGFLDNLHRQFEKPDYPDNIVIVTHSVALCCFLFRWYHWTVEKFDSLPLLPNCHIAVMTRGNDGAFALTEPFAERPFLAMIDNDR